MLFNNDVVTDGEPEPSSFSGGLGREERIEHFFLHYDRQAVVEKINHSQKIKP